MEKLENKIIDMREMYEELKSSGKPMMVDDTDAWVCCCCMASAINFDLSVQNKQTSQTEEVVITYLL
jgi:hypothetical protein